MSVHRELFLLLPLFLSIALYIVFSFPFHYVELISIIVERLMSDYGL